MYCDPCCMGIYVAQQNKKSRKTTPEGFGVRADAQSVRARDFAKSNQYVKGIRDCLYFFKRGIKMTNKFFGVVFGRIEEAERDAIQREVEAARIVDEVNAVLIKELKDEMDITANNLTALITDLKKRSQV